MFWDFFGRDNGSANGNRRAFSFISLLAGYTNYIHSLKIRSGSRNYREVLRSLDHSKTCTTTG
jgi:hypothetical protein